MITVPAKTVETPEGPVISPDGDIPAGWHVRYIAGEFRAIAPDESWADPEPLPPPPPADA